MMTAVHLSWFRSLVLALLFTFVLFAAKPAFADGISFNLQDTSLTAIGGTAIFQGTVTNETGANLNATDLFFNFFGFDPSAITSVDQLLGTPDFALPDGMTSSVVGLFSVTFGPGAAAGQTYAIDAFLQDINENESGIVSVSVTTAAIPEPTTLLLLSTGLLGAAATLRKKCKNK